MINITLRRKTHNFEKLIQKMEALTNEYVETGVFIEQGQHPYAEMSYVELARMHEEGDGDFPPRTVRPLVLNAMDNEQFMSVVSKALTKHFLGNDSANQALSSIGFTMREIGYNFFGKTDMKDMFPNHPETIRDKGFNAPLVDEGYLRDAWAFKTSMSGYVVSKGGV